MKLTHTMCYMYETQEQQYCNTYVDGVTIIYGGNPRKHIWTYACGVCEAVEADKTSSYVCRYNNDSKTTSVPEWKDSDYYCKSGLPTAQNQPLVLYSNQTIILWK